MIKSITATLALLISAAALQAAPLALDPSPKAQARTVVNVVFGDYLPQRVAAKVETAVVDLDKDGVGEIVTRFVHTGSCTADLKICRTTVIRYSGQGWKIVFDHPAAQIEVIPGPNGVPSPIKADRVVWKWNFPVYAPTPDGIGDRVAVETAPRDISASLAPAFGAGAAKLIAADPRYSLSMSKPKISDKDEFIAVTMKGGSACGEMTGCPVRVLRKGKDGWHPVLSTSSSSALYLGTTVRDGYRDLVVDSKLGFAVYGWGGDKYVLADRVEAVEKGAK
jgi:hypothetical protein